MQLNVHGFMAKSLEYASCALGMFVCCTSCAHVCQMFTFNHSLVVVAGGGSGGTCLHALVAATL